MRVAVLTLIALALAGCEHMYGGMDARVTEAEAIKLVSTERVCLQNLATFVSDSGGEWCVSWEPMAAPGENVIGPEGSVCVDKRTGRVGQPMLFHSSPPACPGERS